MGQLDGKVAIVTGAMTSLNVELGRKRLEVLHELG